MLHLEFAFLFLLLQYRFQLLLQQVTFLCCISLFSDVVLLLHLLFFVLFLLQ